MNLHILMYATGEYEDYREYNLAVFLREEEAISAVQELEDAYSDWKGNYTDEEWRLSKPYALDCDYNGYIFYYEDVSIESPELLETLTANYPELLI